MKPLLGKKLILALIGFSALSGVQDLEGATGPHGGQVKTAVGTPAEYQLELVVKSSGTSEEKEIHVYGLNKNGQPVNLYHSGYGGITLRLGKMELPLDCYKVDEANHVSNDADSLHHYRAIGKFPSDPTVELEVRVAFPSKSGTGTAVFHPFRD